MHVQTPTGSACTRFRLDPLEQRVTSYEAGKAMKYQCMYSLLPVAACTPDSAAHAKEAQIRQVLMTQIDEDSFALLLPDITRAVPHGYTSNISSFC